MIWRDIHEQDIREPRRAIDFAPQGPLLWTLVSAFTLLCVELTARDREFGCPILAFSVHKLDLKEFPLLATNTAPHLTGNG